MINISAEKGSSISVNSFTGYVLCNTDWQDWVRKQGENLDQDEGMDIIFKSKLEVEVKTYVGMVSNTTTVLFNDITTGTKQEKSQQWLEQWKKLDKLIIDFTASK